MVTRSYQSKVFIYAVLTLETSLKVDFGRFLTIFGVSQAVRFGTSPLSNFTCSNRICYHSDHLAKNQYNEDQIFKKFRKMCALVWLVDFSYTDQKDLKLCQCLDIDKMTSLSKFGEVT